MRFYRDGLGLPEIGRFRGHDGYDGVFLELPGTGAHLELTSGGAHAAPSAHPESLLVLYLGTSTSRGVELTRTWLPVTPYYATLATGEQVFVGAGSAQLSYAVPSDLAPGKYRFTAVADPDNVSGDVNLANNVDSLLIVTGGNLTSDTVQAIKLRPWRVDNPVYIDTLAQLQAYPGARINVGYWGVLPIGILVSALIGSAGTAWDRSPSL